MSAKVNTDRIELNLPNDKEFKDALRGLYEAERNDRKKYIEKIVINHVKKAIRKKENGK